MKPRVDQRTKDFMKFFEEQGITFVDMDSGEEIDLGEDDAE